MGHSLDQDLTDRFRLDFERALGRAVDGNDRLALAVSGGGDSMAMLMLATDAFPRQVIAASVDHRLRADSADECAMVAAHCAAIGVPHETLAPDRAIAGASIQARARDTRYALLSHWASTHGATVLATAHHLDDQAETFLMRAARGSGLSGLAAIRERRQLMAGSPVILVRPLLGWRRSDLRAIVVDCAVPFVDDPSNLDDRHDRTRFRRLLEANPWLDPPALARSAVHLGDAERAMIAAIDRLCDDRVTPVDDGVNCDIAGLDRETRRHLARRCITAARDRLRLTVPEWTQATGIEPMLDSLSAGKNTTQAGIIIRPTGTLWQFRKAPTRRSL